MAAEGAAAAGEGRKPWFGGWEEDKVEGGDSRRAGATQDGIARRTNRTLRVRTQNALIHSLNSRQNEGSWSGVCVGARAAAGSLILLTQAQKQ